MRIEMPTSFLFTSAVLLSLRNYKLFVLEFTSFTMIYMTTELFGEKIRLLLFLI